MRTSPHYAGAAGSVPGQGAKIPHVSWPKSQNIKQKQHCNKFNKENDPHQKKKKRMALQFERNWLRAGDVVIAS